jgi:hypothetical protein
VRRACAALKKGTEEIVELERYRQVLSFIHQSSLSLRSFQPLEVSLESVLATAVGIAPTPLAVLELQTFAEQGGSRRFFLHLATDPDAAAGKASALEVAVRISISSAPMEHSRRPCDSRTLVSASRRRHRHLEREIGVVRHLALGLGSVRAHLFHRLRRATVQHDLQLRREEHG